MVESLEDFFRTDRIAFTATTMSSSGTATTRSFAQLLAGGRRGRRRPRVVRASTSATRTRTAPASVSRSPAGATGTTSGRSTAERSDEGGGSRAAPSSLGGVRLSVLDQAPISEGSTAAEALHRSVDLGRHVEALGYHRYWVAEHHGTPSLACAAPEV